MSDTAYRTPDLAAECDRLRKRVAELEGSGKRLRGAVARMSFGWLVSISASVVFGTIAWRAGQYVSTRPHSPTTRETLEREAMRHLRALHPSAPDLRVSCYGGSVYGSNCVAFANGTRIGLTCREDDGCVE